jgi:Ca-activated chloride channel family protein
MSTLFAKLKSPVLTGIEVDWHDDSVVAWPKRIPDLYVGEPLFVAARLPRAVRKISVGGRTSEAPWKIQFDVDGGGTDTGINKLWAREMIASLMDELATGADPDRIRTEVTRVALDHHLVSKYTSLVATDVTPTKPGHLASATKPIPVNTPHGTGQQIYYGAMPQGATPGQLFLLLGLLSLISAVALQCWSGRKSRVESRESKVDGESVG